MLTLPGILTVKSPILHHEESPANRSAGSSVTRRGNENSFRRMIFLYEGQEVAVPVVSGNSIRGIFRRLGAQDLLDRLGLKEKDLDKRVYYLLFSGGGLEQKQEGEISPNKVTMIRQTLREKLPLVSLFGASYGYDMLRGKINVHYAIPQVKQTVGTTGVETDMDVSSITGWTFYTRRDDYELDQELKEEEAEKEKGTKQQMIYRVEYMVPGVVLSHKFVFHDTITPIELSCFATILQRFLEHPYLGGKASSGHGEVEAYYTWPKGMNVTPDNYAAFVEEKKGEIVDYLQSFRQGQPPLQ